MCFGRLQRRPLAFQHNESAKIAIRALAVLEGCRGAVFNSHATIREPLFGDLANPSTNMVWGWIALQGADASLEDTMPSRFRQTASEVVLSSHQNCV